MNTARTRFLHQAYVRFHRSKDHKSLTVLERYTRLNEYLHEIWELYKQLYGATHEKERPDANWRMSEESEILKIRANLLREAIHDCKACRVPFEVKNEHPHHIYYPNSRNAQRIALRTEILGMKPKVTKGKTIRTIKAGIIATVKAKSIPTPTPELTWEY